MDPRFHTGDRVVVREAYPIGHVRTPYYIRGKHGEIERMCGIARDAGAFGAKLTGGGGGGCVIAVGNDAAVAAAWRQAGFTAFHATVSA